MQPDDELCLCFHVSMRKVVNFVRIEKPTHVSQLSECSQAGTGCGWCRPFLQRIFDAQRSDQQADLPSSQEYGQARSTYIKDGKGTPPE